MLFQTLDDKKECVGIYVSGEISFDGYISEHLTKTWSYSSFLSDRDDVQYAKIYCGGKSLEEACPEALRDQWQVVEKKFKAYIKSFITSRVALSENCFYDLVPRKFLLELCHIKDLICEHVFKTYEKPKDYVYLLEIAKEIERIRHIKLKYKLTNLQMFKSKHRKFRKKLDKISPFIKFSSKGTKTGRMITEKGSFPILNVEKELRSVLVPNNDYFIEIDFNAAELRTLISLQGKDQPKEDIHLWNVKNIFKQLTRAEAKKKIFAWLYNPESDDYLASRAYDRESVVQKYFTQGQVTTFFGKVIPSESRTALNYIIQSTCAENVLRQMIKVSNYIQDKGLKSYVSFSVHDSIVIDFSVEDKEHLKKIIDIFSETELGKFLVNVSAGTDFGNLNDLEIT